MVTAGEIMTRKVVSVTPESSCLEAVRLLTDHKVSGLPVIDHDGDLRGIITEKDVLKLLLSEDTVNRKVEDYMTHHVTTFTETTNIVDICKFFIKSAVRRVPIINQDDKVVGVLSRRDLISEIKRIKSI